MIEAKDVDTFLARVQWADILNSLHAASTIFLESGY